MKRHVRPALVAIFTALSVFFALAALNAQPQLTDPPKPSFKGKVVSIADGDTITVLLDKQQHKIRLDGIDAPESHQAFGTKSKKALADKVFGQEVEIRWSSRDKYKRIIGEVFLGDRRICLEMVQEGMAWHYVQYSKDADLAKAQKDAKEKKIGLWSDPNPIAPWEFRKGLKSDEEKKAKTNDDLSQVTVYVTNSGKKYHREGCRSLAKSSNPMKLGEVAGKYAPCSICNPPTLSASRKEPDSAKKEEVKPQPKP